MCCQADLQPVWSTRVARGGLRGLGPPATEKKYQIRHHQICFFKPKVHQNLFLAGAPDPAGGAYDAPTPL